MICNAFGQEYMRSHRSLRELANRLAQSGFHVLRFDYHGCGDSAGESDAGTLEQWQSDIAAAVCEIREASASDRVALVGLRLGATLAAQLAKERDDLDHLVLWDPILDGPAYLRELKDAHDLWIRQHAHRANRPEEGAPREALGFPIPPAVADGLQRIHLDGEPWPAAQVLVIDHRSTGGGKVWSHDDGLGRTLVPHGVLESIASWVESTCR